MSDPRSEHWTLILSIVKVSHDFPVFYCSYILPGFFFLYLIITDAKKSDWHLQFNYCICINKSVPISEGCR